MPTGFWRGVGPNNNVFAIESFMDELARKAGKDPVAFRRENLTRNPRLTAALELVAAEVGLGPAPAAARRPRRHRAALVRQLHRHGRRGGGGRAGRGASAPRGRRAVDTGIAVNPDTVAAQLQGGLIFGLTAALYGEITLDKGRVQQSNFHDYRMLRIDQVPPIEVHVITSGEAPGGIGETGTTAGPPALRNAIYAATGDRPAAAAHRPPTSWPEQEGMTVLRAPAARPGRRRRGGARRWPGGSSPFPGRWRSPAAPR